jgi:glucose 1-dehydrogenase
MSGNTAYCLAKGDMRMVTRTAGVELAKHNISPSGSVRAVATPINLSTMDAIRPSSRSSTRRSRLF